MENEYKLQDQVVVRRPMLHGRGAKLIKLGTIIAFADNGKKAVVSFPADHTRATISLDQLEPVKARFARARVNLDPMRRQISSYMR